MTCRVINLRASSRVSTNAFPSLPPPARSRNVHGCARVVFTYVRACVRAYVRVCAPTHLDVHFAPRSLFLAAYCRLVALCWEKTPQHFSCAEPRARARVIFASAIRVTHKSHMGLPPPPPPHTHHPHPLPSLTLSKLRERTESEVTAAQIECGAKVAITHTHTRRFAAISLLLRGQAGRARSRTCIIRLFRTLHVRRKKKEEKCAGWSTWNLEFFRFVCGDFHM